MRISLLRAPKYPDSTADMGRHRFQYAVYPHRGGWQDAGVVAQGFDFNVPMLPTDASIDSLFSVDTSDLVIDTVKLAETDDALVLRLYEAHGARGRAHVTLGLDATSVTRANLLEECVGTPVGLDGRSIDVDYRPFEIITLLLRR